MKKYPLTILVHVAICILSFMPVPETPLSDVAFIDKWTHLVMYGGLTLTIWFEYLRLHGLRLGRTLHGLRYAEVNHGRLLTVALLWPVVLGGLVEVLQENCTNHVRSGDWIDWLADAAGSVIAWLLCYVVIKVIKWQ